MNHSVSIIESVCAAGCLLLGTAVSALDHFEQWLRVGAITLTIIVSLPTAIRVIRSLFGHTIDKDKNAG